MATTLTHNEMLNQPKVANLMRWIDSHDRPALTLFDTATGELIVSSIALDLAGGSYEMQERIPATVGAARELLGY